VLPPPEDEPELEPLLELEEALESEELVVLDDDEPPLLDGEE
jgi:hypothetical protein